MYQAVIFSFKVSQIFIVYESVEDRNLRAVFSSVKNALSCNIFTKQYCNWDVLLIGQRWTCFLEPLFFLRALKMVYYGFGPKNIWCGAAFTCCRFSQKKKNSLETLIVIFETFHQRVFSDCMNRRNFEIPVLTENSRLQPASLKFLAKRLPSIIISTIKWLLDL